MCFFHVSLVRQLHACDNLQLLEPMIIVSFSTEIATNEAVFVPLTISLLYLQAQPIGYFSTGVNIEKHLMKA